MSGVDFRTEFLYRLPAAVLCEFCRQMDGLPDPEWSRFASEVLTDQTDVRLAERRERRTDWVMNQWQSRNGRVGELLDLLEGLQLLRQRDVILSCSSSLRALPPPPPPLPPPVSLSLFDPPAKPIVPLPLPTHTFSDPGGREGVRPLPKPGPPPPSLDTGKQQAPVASTGVMCWSYEEVHAGTEGFSPALKVGEGGFGTVYRACMRNTVFAVKRLKEDSPLDWSVVKQSFRTEVEKLSQFRHPNIVELLGFSEAGGCFCIIYSFMENKSLEDQLHTVGSSLSWQQRVGVAEGASRALQFLHCPPRPHSTLIHGDVKSSNILLDQHLEAKLADFGLARFGRAPSGRLATQTASVGQTATVRGTLAYLPDEYVKNGELSPAVDVYSFGVVLLEVLTGRQALEVDKSKAIYLKDLALDQDSVDWRSQVDRRLSSGGAAEPAGCMEVAALACRCLNKRRKKRPAMTEVFDTLRDVHNLMKKSSCSSACGTSFPPPHLPHPQAFPRPPQSLQSSVEALPEQMSRLGPLEDTYQSSSSSSSSSLSLFSSSSSSSSSLTPPHPLHSSSSLPPISSLPIPPSSCSLSFAGPCESDESQGFSQYLAPSQLCGAAGNQYRRPSWANGTHHRAVTPPNTHQYSPPSQPVESHYSPPSAPSGHFPPRHPDRSGAPPAGRVWTGSLSKPQYGITPDSRGRARADEHPGAQMGSAAASDHRNYPGTCCPTAQSGAQEGSCPGPYGIAEGPSPAGSLRSSSPELPVHINPCKQRFLVKKTLYEEGRIRTPELLSSDDLYADSSADSRGPEESDELDYLPAQPTAD